MTRGSNDNGLSVHGNRSTMNLNAMILTNIQSSYYFKVELYELKTYHEVIDEIYNKVTHLEPWEKGSRHTRGLKGMCGGVRGVGGGGIVSTAFCILYKLYTLKLTRKQVIGLTTHPDSPYIRGLGFMYLRYTQPPHELWDWFQEFLSDKEEFDVRAGGGEVMTIGNMLQRWLVRIDWFDTLFPRIPISIQKVINANIIDRFGEKRLQQLCGPEEEEREARTCARNRQPNHVRQTSYNRRFQSTIRRDEEDEGDRSPSRPRRRGSREWHEQSPNRRRRSRSRH
ncbi:hypothetical protein ACOME3_007429 [Neoechinorhynchus agilis]